MPPPPKGRPRGGLVTKDLKKILCPPCLGEALSRVSIVRQFLWFWFERYEFMPVSTEQKKCSFSAPSGFDAHVTGPAEDPGVLLRQYGGFSIYFSPSA
jgi:hypothetical protein